MQSIIPPSLEALIARVERHQQALRLNDARFVARYQRHLKSVDSWSRTLRRRDTERLNERNYARWTANLTALVAEVEDAAGGEQVYPLPILAEAIQLYERLQGARGDIRVGWLIGTTGVGKSVSLRHLAKTHQGQTAYVIVPALWRDNRTALTQGLARALNVEPAPGDHVSEIFEAVVARLNVAPTTMLMDEFHEGGILLVKLIKTLIERTPTRFILTTWPLGYARLISGAEGLGETRQLVGRSLRPVAREWQHGPRTADIAEYLGNAVPALDAETRGDLARGFAPGCRRWGFRLLLQAVEMARSLADAGDKDLTADMLRDAFAAIADDIIIEK